MLACQVSCKNTQNTEYGEILKEIENCENYEAPVEVDISKI